MKTSFYEFVLQWGRRPIVVLGHGARVAGVDVDRILGYGAPVLTSWQAADLVDNWHPNYFGRPGIYGQRVANKIMYEADHIVSIGCRLTPWMIGHAGLRKEQTLTFIDVDSSEAARFDEQAQFVKIDAAEFVEKNMHFAFRDEWLAQCKKWKSQYPLIEEAHADTDGYINSYRFVANLERFFKRDQIIVTDVGALMCPVFQVLKLRPPQRLMTSGGLGEMGCGLPAAIGASFATGKGEVLCLVGDGGMQMNMQELQTIVHHQLPVKIIVFENDGYGMIKGTHKNLRFPYTGVSKASGVSAPDFCRIADAYDIGTCDVRTWAEANRWIPAMMESKRPFLMQVHIDPEQTYVPRLQPTISTDGKITPAIFGVMSPILEAENA